MADKIDPYDVAALERSLNDSATRVSTIWVSFLVFGLYLTVAAGTATHRQLFLEEPVKLPALNIDLPLWGFYFLAPILFIIFHGYVLLQVLLLNRTAAAYNAALDKVVKRPPANASMRQRLANTLFAQIFAGSPRERDGWLGWLLRAMMWITLAIAPLLILLLFQFKFLPYHSHIVTWSHRMLIIIELVALFLLWPLILDARRDLQWAHLFRPLPAAITVIASVLTLAVATFPGEWHVNLATGQAIDTVQCDRWLHQRFALADLRFDRMNLLRIRVVDDEKLERIIKATKDSGEQPWQGERTQYFRDRNLNCGDFYLADLRRVDFSGARLRAASFNASYLDGASFASADVQNASFFFARLHGATLYSGDFRGASFSFARLQGASLNNARLQGANLTGAWLQGASLDNAQLQSARLAQVWLVGASLDKAQLQGALLDGSAALGVSLNHAQLQGASLNLTQLQGVSLTGTQLQGTSLDQASLVHTRVENANVWRASGVNCSDGLVASINRAVTLGERVGNDGILQPIPATAEETAQLIEQVLKEVPAGKLRDEALKRLRTGLLFDPAKDYTAEIERVWAACEEASKNIDQDKFNSDHVTLLRNLVCDAEDSRTAIGKGIIRNWISGNHDRHAFSTQLARGLLGEDGRPCAATEDFDKGDIKRLRAAIAKAPPTAAQKQD